METFIGTERYLTYMFKTSTTLAYCKYDTLHSLLLVIFHNGTGYEYSGVDLQTYQELIAAPSAGIYFGKVIRGKYKTERVV